MPYQARVFTEFLPEERLCHCAGDGPLAFARLGEKQNRARARIKFRRETRHRRVQAAGDGGTQNTADPRWTAYLPEAHKFQEMLARAASSLNGTPHPEGFDEWTRTNVYRQRQAGYAVATVTLPIGDITARQLATRRPGAHV